MKNRLWGLFFVAMIAIIGYIMVSTAASHTAKDEAELQRWKMNWMDRR